MCRANPTWGAPRIHGELLKLGITIAEATVGRYMVRRRSPPSQTWRTFLTNHVRQLVAVDFFVVPTLTFRVLFVFVVLAHDRRQILHVKVTGHPTAAWTSQQLRNAFPWDTAPRFLLRDRDGPYGEEFRGCLDGTQRDLWMLPQGGEPTPLLATEFNERAPRLSPDGRWLAYVSDQAGEDRVYVRSFPDGAGVITVSTGPGTEPVWARDGSELFYRNGNQMFAAAITMEPTFSVGRRSPLFDDRYALDPSRIGIQNYDVSLDGRFLMVATGNADSAAGTITLVLNRFEELKNRVPVP